MTGVNALSQIRNKMIQCQGLHVVVNERNGRHKNRSQNGVISEIYGNIFTVEVANGEATQKICYSYSDILTKKVVLKRFVQ